MHVFWLGSYIVGTSDPEKETHKLWSGGQILGTQRATDCRILIPSFCGLELDGDVVAQRFDLLDLLVCQFCFCLAGRPFGIWAGTFAIAIVIYI